MKTVKEQMRRRQKGGKEYVKVKGRKRKERKKERNKERKEREREKERRRTRRKPLSPTNKNFTVETPLSDVRGKDSPAGVQWGSSNPSPTPT